MVGVGLHVIVPVLASCVQAVMLVFTSPAEAVAKYCDEYVCLSVCLCVCLCLSANISPEYHARSLPIFLCLLPGRGSVLLGQGDEILRGRGNFLGFLRH